MMGRNNLGKIWAKIKLPKVSYGNVSLVFSVAGVEGLEPPTC